MGVRWATDLYSAILDSPVVSYNSTLNKTIVYIGNADGLLYAIDKATGSIIWSIKLDGPITSTPLVSNGSVWVASEYNPTVYKLDDTTGATECSVTAPGIMYSTPVAATPPGGTASVYFGAGHHVLSVNADNCAIQWDFSGVPTTVWDPVSFAVGHGGTPMIMFGSADPDCSVYAVNAKTGGKVWKYQTDTHGDNDVGSGITTTPPGVNGFSDGVAYAPAKDGYVYAINLTTGTLIWKSSLGTRSGTPNESLSTSALDGNTLIVGQAVGVSSFDATTGKMKWTYSAPVDSRLSPPAPPEVISSPAISGPAGQEVVSFGDLGGAFRALSLASGTLLYSYQMGTTWDSASPAVSGSDVLVGSADGFLYDFSPGGGNTAPTTTITSPTQATTVANPGGNLTVTGTAADGMGVASVVVAIRQGGSSGTWWNPGTSRWSPTPVTMRAILASTGATSTNWTASFSVPPSGNAYQVDAYTVSMTGASAVPAADDQFYVSPASGEPTIGTSTGYAGPGAGLWVHGSGYGPNESVVISLLGSMLGQATTDSSGAFAAIHVTVPATDGFGQTAVLATGMTSGMSTTASLDIANSWDQQGGDPGHTSNESNDSTLDDMISPGDNIMLTPAWLVAADSVLTAPVIADQVAYAGSRNGTLYAIRTQDGSQLWTWHTPDSSAITSTPAVDGMGNLAFVGATDGMLYAVHTAGRAAGTLAWSVKIGSGTVKPPVFDGTDVYAASADGQVMSLTESTGSVVWEDATTSQVTTAPALDVVLKTLVVPTNNSIIGYNATTGNTTWTFATSTPASPIISQGTVYVGSSNDHVYALNEHNGKQLWAFKAGGAIVGSGALTYTSTGAALELWIASGDRQVHAINAETGHGDKSVVSGALVPGFAISGSTAVYPNSIGAMTAVRTAAVTTIVWGYATNGGSMSVPALVDGTVYISDGKGNLYAFTPYGYPPA
jgi:outer membrane protein assembly factor BamB